MGGGALKVSQKQRGVKKEERATREETEKGGGEYPTGV